MKKLYFFLFLLFTCSKLQAQTFASQNMSLLSNWSDSSVTAEPVYNIKYNGIWGWHDGNGSEYALVGASNGVFFVNVTNPTAPVTCDFLPGRRDECIWREIKTYQNYAYLVSDDGLPNSFQIVDLSYLPDSVHVVYDNVTLIDRAHTIWVDNDKLYMGIPKGPSVSGYSAMAVYSLANPALPVFLRKIEQDFPNLLSNQQVHDMFVRNDTVYASCAFDGLFIFKYNANNTFSLLGSITSYPGQGYNHSSALSDDGQTLVFMDEVPNALPVKVADVSSPSAITVLSTFASNAGATPHNPFILGDLCYIAYYMDGMQVYDISNPLAPVRVGYFDTHYQTIMGVSYPSPAYAGAWGAYPYLPSGRVLVSDMQNGLFVLDASALLGVTEPVQPTEAVIFPNPASSTRTITLQLPSTVKGNVQIEVEDALGRTVLVSQCNDAPKCQLSPSGLSAGNYLIRVESDGYSKAHKLLITD